MKKNNSHTSRNFEESEFQAQYFLQHADDYIYRLNAQGIITYCNPAVERILKLSREDIIGKNYLEFVHPDFREEIVHHHLSQWEKGLPSTHSEFPVLTKDGSDVWVEQIVQVIQEGNTTTGFQAIGRDITRRKHTEDLLKNKNDFLSSLHETTLALIHRLDTGDILRIITDRSAALAGTGHVFAALIDKPGTPPVIRSASGIFTGHIGKTLPPEETVTDKVLTEEEPFVHTDYTNSRTKLPWDQCEHITVFAEIPFKAGPSLSGIIGAAFLGTEHNFERESIQYLNQLGQIASIALENARLFSNGQREIARRMEIEQELRNSRSNLADIINYLPDPTFVIDNDGTVIAWNNAMEDLTGVSEKVILEKGNHEYSLPFYRDRRPMLIDFALENNTHEKDTYGEIKADRDTLIAEIYIPFLGAGGTYLWEKAKPLYDSYNNIVGAIETVRDLTDRKKAEENLRSITQQVIRNQMALNSISRFDNTDLDDFLGKVTETASTTLHTERVSIWFYNGDRSELICADMYIAGENSHKQGIVYTSNQFRDYFRAVESHRIITAPDALTDSRTSEFAGPVFGPEHISSVMDVTIRMSGKVVGVLRHEHSGSRRDWSLEEQDFATSVSDAIALALASNERKAAEDALQEQKQFTENLIQNSALATIVIDNTHRVMLWNKACEILTGIPASEMVGTDNQWKAFYTAKRPTLPDLMIDDLTSDLGKYYDVFSKSVLTSSGWHAEGWYKNLGGMDRYILFEATPITNNNGEVIAAIENIQDITALKITQEEVMRIRSYLKNIIDSMPSIIVGVDTNVHITHWNLEAEKAAGISEEHARGRLLTELLPELKPQLNTIETAMRMKCAQKVERIHKTRDSGPQWLDIMVYPLIEDNVLGAVIRIDDVTSRVRIEEMMVQTEKMMSVGGLAAGMAHEINNPLGGILLGAQNIIRRISPDIKQNVIAAEQCGVSIESVRSYMESRNIIHMIQGIREMGERASKIVANMLSFSRQSGTKFTHADLGELINRTIDLAANDYNLKKKYDFRHIAITKDFSSDLPAVYCVETEIQQVILNLLKNSTQALGESAVSGKTPHIILRLRKNDENAVIEVEDNGPGMEEEVRKRVFEPFYTTKEVGTGTGLGLSVSYFIITNNHRGSMEVSSVPGTGTCFTIYLPIQRRNE
ncbi:MAG TPA: PAS domain S-box protein [Spirochaetota bacterium]|nr:PAS domain S-box protein [Spirochaetota bacterium]